MPHSILDRPYEWKIVELRFVADDEAWLELRLAKNGVTRRLRFRGVLDLQLERGFPSAPGLVIDDVSDRQLEGIGVLVTDREAGNGGLHFWARDVVDADHLADE